MLSETMFGNSENCLLQGGSLRNDGCYDILVATKEWSIAEMISRLSWDSNPVYPDKNPML